MSDGPPSDATVIRRCRSGDVELFRVLVDRYQDRVYNLARRLLDDAEEARDASQEAFVRAYTALDRFDPERPFAPWLFRIATNVCYGNLRKRRAMTLSLDAMDEWEADALLVDERSETDPCEHLARRVRDEEIQRAVLALPPRYRTVVLLRYHEDLPYEAIAEALGLPLGTVKTLLYRAHRRLEAALTVEREDE